MIKVKDWMGDLNVKVFDLIHIPEENTTQDHLWDQLNKFQAAIIMINTRMIELLKAQGDQEVMWSEVDLYKQTTKRERDILKLELDIFRIWVAEGTEEACWNALAGLFQPYTSCSHLPNVFSWCFITNMLHNSEQFNRSTFLLILYCILTLSKRSPERTYC